MAEGLRDRIIGALEGILDGQEALHCTRVWEAWAVGTMTEDDFEPVTASPEAIEELADAVLVAIASDLDKIKAEAQATALREAADEAEAWEVAIHGSAHYDSDVLFSIRERADRIAREAGITTEGNETGENDG